MTAIRYQPKHSVEDARRLAEQSRYEAIAEVVACAEILRQLLPNQRRPWLAHVIQEMYDEQDGLCALTGEPLESDFEVDHIIPFSYGGGNERSNLRLVNKTANRKRGNTEVDVSDLLSYLEDRWMNR